MDLYGQKGKSLPQKIVIIALELLLLRISYWILFEDGGQNILRELGMEEVTGVMERKIIMFAFSCIVFLRMSFMMFYLLKRKIPWEESLSVPMAFALYYIGFSLLVLPTDQAMDYVDYLGIALFLVGSLINTYSELQRHFWKQRPENKGKLYTQGLFRYSMHINFFGDLLWVSAYAIITRNYYSIAIPVLLFCLFAFFNIPKLDQYLQSRYGQQFEKYRSNTKKLIPLIY